MREALGALLVAVLLPMSASADTAVRSSLGFDLGRHDHPEHSGGMVGLDLDLEARFGMFLVGGSLGYDGYAAPMHASTYTGRAGVSMPLATPAPDAARKVQFDVIAALELGMHRFSPDGEEKEFLGPTVTYVGDTASSNLVGARLGTAMTIHRAGWSNGLVFKLELVGRRDLSRADVAYRRTSCGGLFVDGCSEPTDHVASVGGTELGMRVAFGVQFGR
jgi:hypothetical protein